MYYALERLYARNGKEGMYIERAFSLTSQMLVKSLPEEQ
jgi:hypothetical protein